MIYSLQKPQDFQNALGFLPMYSISPALSYTTSSPYQNHHSSQLQKKTTKTDFVSIGEKDSSNILKTLEFLYVQLRISKIGSEQKENKEPVNKDDLIQDPINFYIIEDHPLHLLRSLIGFEILRNPELSISDKINIYSDFFGNFYITKRSREVILEILINFERIFSDDDKADQKMADIYIQKGLKYKERDQIAALIRLWMAVFRQESKDKEYWEESKFWVEEWLN
jgi:hypothetical protein